MTSGRREGAPEALSGLCTFDVTVKTSAGDFTVPASVRVFGVTVPDADKSEFSLEYFLDPFTSLAGERWGDDREKFLSSYCESLAMIRNNSLDVQIIPLLCDAKSKRISETEWDLDFSYVGKYVDFMTARVPTRRWLLAEKFLLMRAMNGKPRCSRKGAVHLPSRSR